MIQPVQQHRGRLDPGAAPEGDGCETVQRDLGELKIATGTGPDQ
jgi:hypothetical protein